jgi:hypothetical protein
VTEGNGHVIDPAGEARRALQAVVAERGTAALSNAVLMDGVCRDRLGGLPGEAILIGSAARSDVPALLRDRIGREGTYGAIQSVAATLAQAHGLDPAASLWVVREFARALSLVGSGGTQPTVMERAVPGPGPGSGAGGPAGQGDAMPPGSAAPPGGSAGGGAAGGGTAGGGTAGGGTAGGGTAGGGTAGGGAGPGRRPGGARVPSRNVLGIAAAVALVAVYLGVAAVAHLSPFAKTVASSTSLGGSQGNVGSPSPVGSPDPAPDPDPDPDPDPPAPSAYDTLLNMIPSSVQGDNNNCSNDGTSYGARVVAECTNLQGLAATTIIYYLFSDTATLSKGFSSFLTSSNFPSSAQSCTTNNKFSDFITNCRDTYTSTSPAIGGSVAEYVNKTNDPIIVSTDRQQLVMAVLIGTNDADLLAYWQPLQWIDS